jgi:hypothetical protein
VHIELVDTRVRSQARRFLNVPFRIYADNPAWVPPLASDAARMLDQAHHPFYRHSQAAFFLAVDDGGRPCGRMAMLDNRNFNEFNRERTAFFYLFETINDPLASHALFAAGFDWARSRGLNKVIGPRGFTALDGLGMLVDGFEHRPAIGIPFNPAYYPELVEAEGFSRQDDLVSGYLDAAMDFPDKIHRASELIQKRRGLRVVAYSNRRQLRALVPHLKDLYNASLGGTSGNVPLTDDEAQAMADQLLWFADPRLIKILWKEDRPVGFLFAYPDISAALQRTRGRLFPLGWIDLLLELRRTKWININGAGIVEEYRGLGGTAILFSEMFKSVADGGFRQADLVQVGTSNDRMQRELRDLGIDFYKTHRVYERSIG